MKNSINFLLLAYFFYNLLIMEQIDRKLSFDIEINSVDESYLLQPRITVGPELVPNLVRKSYIFFVLELRSGVGEDTLKNLLSHLLQSCEEVIEKGLDGISFVVNGQHHPVKHLQLPSIRELLTSIMIVANSDDYLETLQKTRHAVLNVSQRLSQAKVTLLFFFSYVAIDHSLGLKKRSYIDHLNEHSDQCLEEVHRLSKTIRSYTEQCKCYIISYDKSGEEEEDYSLADTELMNQISLLVGNYGSSLYRNVNNSQLGESFRSVTALLLNELYSVSINLPVVPTPQSNSHLAKYYLVCNDLQVFKPTKDLFIPKTRFDVERANQGQVWITDAKSLEEKLGVVDAKPNLTFRELSLSEMIVARSQLYSEQLGQISWRLSQEIVKYKRKYELGKSFLVMSFDQPLLLQLRGRVFEINEIGKQIYLQIFSNDFHNKSPLFDQYNELKVKIDTIQEVLLGVFKKQIGGSEIGKLSQLVNLGNIKRALKNKLIRRINANPYLLDQVYRQVEAIVDSGTIDFLDLQVNSQDLRSELGNCILSDYNFVKAMKEYDSMGVAFELERPESAIADPGRIRVRQVSPFLMRTSQFFEKFIYKINYTPELVNVTLGRCALCKKYNCPFLKHRIIEETEVLRYKKEQVKVEQVQWNKDISSNSLDQALTHNERIVSDVTFEMREIDYLRDMGDLQKSNYSERCDYTDRANRTPTVLGFMPLYLTKEHWLVAKQLMKPSLAWTATGEPLGYLFAQYQTIPFIVLSNLIRRCKEQEYSLEQEYKQVNLCKNERELNEVESKVNAVKSRLRKMKNLLRVVEQTCKHIMLELSTEKYENKLIDQVRRQYLEYVSPINRTIDVISNNSAFIGQLYCALNGQLIPKPKEQDFHEFFVRLVEEELRRETDGWNEEETQDRFIDKLLNVESVDIKQWSYSVVGGEQYLQKFQTALEGERVAHNHVELQRQELEMMLRKEGKFNDAQLMLLIEYKRLYENRVLWLWFVRFLLYGEVERVKIHKWRCLGLNNSYMLFALIIQNKKQRKNYRRREAILSGEYVDPFLYEKAREFLENEFIQLRAKKEGEVLKKHHHQVCVRAAEIFSQTGCLEEAAGTLVDFNQNSLPSFYSQLRRGKAVRVDEKLKMLLNGSFRGVLLFKGWKMSRAKFERLRKTYPAEFIRYQYKF